MATVYDVCVIGSGPAGGVLAKELAERGAKVVLIEAGREMRPADFHFHAWPYELPQRQSELSGPTAAYPPELGLPLYEDCDHISLDRIRAIGGRSIHWNANCFRFAARDFRERSVSGVEEDWPISYEEMAPYYAHVEKMIGVCGTRENLEILPDAIAYLRPLKFRCSEEIVKRACDKMGIRMIPTRKAVLTEPYDNRPPCHYCGHCMEGCDVGAIFSVPGAMLPKARRTGNLTLMSERLARELIVNREGKVRPVSLVATGTRGEEEVRARIFALCCATAESPRLLLNSRSPRFPNGLANSSDCVGRYLHGHNTAGIYGYLEELVGSRPINNDGATDHSYIPRLNIGDGKRRDYAGGYQFQLQDFGFMYPYQAQYLKGFGRGFKQRVRFLQPGFIGMDCYSKVLARPENRITVDRGRVDSYGIPLPVIHFKFCRDDVMLWHEMKDKAKEILDAAKCRLIIDTSPEPSGFASHEVGTVRMGKDPRMSVLNGYNQAHDIPNLFVVDGSSFTTYPEKNPTLTIMALAVRAADFITSESHKGRL